MITGPKLGVLKPVLSLAVAIISLLSVNALNIITPFLEIAIVLQKTNLLFLTMEQIVIINRIVNNSTLEHVVVGT